MASYNHAAFIGASIESVRRQTYRDWELIIVDDGSDDDTPSVVSAFADDCRISFFREDRIHNGSKIKNLGIARSSGEMIAFLDSDDLWHETKLEKQVEALGKYPAAGFCLVGGYNFNENDQPSEYFYKQRSGFRFGNIFQACFQSDVAAFTQALLVRRENLADTGYFNEAIPFGDMEFILALALNHPAVILYEPLFFRRIHRDNYSREKQIEWHRKGIEMISSYKPSLPNEVFTAALFRSHINLGEKYLKSGKHLDAARQFLNGWRYRPFSVVPLKKIMKSTLTAFKK